MVSTLTWVLVGVALFWAGALALRARGLLPESVGVYGPLITLHTKRGRAFLDWLARPKRLWRAWGNFGLGIAVVMMLGSVLFLLFVAWATARSPSQVGTVSRPQNVLVVPGVNEFLPLSVAPEIVLGLLVGLVVHEGGHGVLCRVEDIDIESLGLLFLTVVPAGAFVEPDPESQERASRGGRGRMFAAGVTNNFAVTVLAFGLLFGPVVGSLGVVSGAAVAGTLDGSPAATAGIDEGDVIVGVNGQSVETNEDLDRVLSSVPDRTVEIDLASGGSASVTRSVLVIDNGSRSVTGDVRGLTSLPTSAHITAVDGTTVHTLPDLRDIVEDRPVATVETADGRAVTTPIGALVSVQPDGPFAAADAPPGPFVVTRIDGERVVSASDLQDRLAETRPGQTVTIEGYTEAGEARYDVVLGENERDGTGFLGVLIEPGVSGATLSDFGVGTYPAGRYLGALGGDCAACEELPLSFVDRTFLALQFPVASVTGSALFPYNFAGFTGGVTNFYVAEGPLAPLGIDALLLLANALFWTAWINLNLGFFNCIPTFMLDGGHLLRATAESVAARLPVERRGDLVTALTVTVQLVMLGSLFVLVFGAQLFG